MSEQPIPPLYDGLIDDAALFPPGNAAMADALTSHAHHRASWYGTLVGPLLCPDTRLHELLTALHAMDPAVYDADHPLDLGLIITGGAGAIEPAVTWVARAPELQLHGIEIALRDEPDAARNARRIGLALVPAGIDDPDQVPVSVEVPPGPGSGGPPGAGLPTEALDTLAESGHRAKLRTGTPDGAAPSPEHIAHFVLECLDRELSFKCTAGLHHAVRTEGDEQHGFLNLLAATRAAVGGANEPDLIRALAETDPLVLQSDLGALSGAAARSTRRWFTSFGSCSITDPLTDLTSLELIQEPA